MKTLEALYYGYIHPSEYDIQTRGSRQKLLELITRHEQDLLATLNESQQESFHKFKDCEAEFLGLTEGKVFADGFTLATKMMTEVMTEE